MDLKEYFENTEAAEFWRQRMAMARWMRLFMAGPILWMTEPSP